MLSCNVTREAPVTFLASTLVACLTGRVLGGFLLDSNGGFFLDGTASVKVLSNRTFGVKESNAALVGVDESLVCGGFFSTTGSLALVVGFISAVRRVVSVAGTSAFVAGLVVVVVIILIIMPVRRVVSVAGTLALPVVGLAIAPVRRFISDAGAVPCGVTSNPCQTATPPKTAVMTARHVATLVQEKALFPGDRVSRLVPCMPDAANASG